MSATNEEQTTNIKTLKVLIDIIGEGRSISDEEKEAFLDKMGLIDDESVALSPKLAASRDAITGKINEITGDNLIEVSEVLELFSEVGRLMSTISPNAYTASEELIDEVTELVEPYGLTDPDAIKNLAIVETAAHNRFDLDPHESGPSRQFNDATNETDVKPATPTPKDAEEGPVLIKQEPSVNNAPQHLA